MPTAPGSLDGQEVTIERDGVVLARGTLSDTRQQTYRTIPTQGGNVMRKAGRITGDVVIEIDEVADDELADEMRQRASQQRISRLNRFEIVLEDGAVIPDCSLATCWGGTRFSLSGI